jgi:Leucine-rich repeat (LRR) protein
MKKQVFNLVLLSLLVLGLYPGRVWAQPGDLYAEESVFTDLKAALEYKGQVKHLNLSNQKLKKIPKEVFEFPNLRTLDLSNNKLTELPKEIGLLTKLEELNLTKNKIDEMPKEIGNLNRLLILKFRSNSLYVLPKEIGKLSRLEQVDLNGNPLWRLPEEFKTCTNLKFMDIRNTEIDKSEFSYIKTMFPGVEIFFTDGCNCGPGN